MAKTETQFVICINNDGYEASLETRKIYVTLPDAGAAAEGMIRIIDESGDDYLFPAAMFHAVALSPAESKAVLDAA